MQPLTIAPDRVDGYTLQRVLGRGGMSTVYLATGADDRQVALKLFAAGTEHQSATRYQREARLLSDLRHPNLTRLFDHDCTPDSFVPYIAMEFVDGPDLATVLAGGMLDLADVASLGAAVASATAYLHARGIVHRDIKPANIVVPATAGHPQFAQAKLTDFGIAMMVDSTRVTTEGLAVGTANYLSPEQVAGKPVTGASDVYALGLVLLEAVTGQRPFDGSGIEAALARLSRPPAIPPTLPRNVASLIRAMTATEPSRRPSSREVHSRLQQLAMAPSVTTHAMPTVARAWSRFGVASRAFRPAPRAPRIPRVSRGVPLRATLAGSAALLAGVLVTFAATQWTDSDASTSPSSVTVPSTAASSGSAAPAGSAGSSGGSGQPGGQPAQQPVGGQSGQQKGEEQPGQAGPTAAQPGGQGDEPAGGADRNAPGNKSADGQAADNTAADDNPAGQQADQAGNSGTHRKDGKAGPPGQRKSH